MRVAMYLRVGNKSQLMDAQESCLRNYAQQHGHEVVAVFSEFGSACAPNREIIEKLIQLPSNQVEGVLAVNVSRIHRDMFSFSSWLKELDASGKKFITVHDGVVPYDKEKSVWNFYNEVSRRYTKKSKKV